MNTISVIYALGPEGTNGHRVALAAQRNLGIRSTIQLLPSHSEILESVSRGGPGVYGIVPIENSTEGPVGDVLRFWLDRHSGEIPGADKVQVIREFSLPIRHHVLIREGAEISSLKHVFSHWQAIGQCRSNLKKHGLKSSAVSSTAVAAKMVSHKLEVVGALGSEFLAEIYGLQIAMTDVQDSEYNVTKFHLVSHSECVHQEGLSKTAIIFHIKNDPGALVKVLSVFGDIKVNMASVHSIPLGKPDELAFYCEFDGYLIDLPVFLRIKPLTTQLMMLGSYGCQHLGVAEYV